MEDVVILGIIKGIVASCGLFVALVKLYKYRKKKKAKRRSLKEEAVTYL